MTRVAIPAVTAFLVSVTATHLCKTLALRFGIVSSPRSDRWNHRPTPLLGGVAIVASIFAVLPFVVPGSLQTRAFLGGAFALFAIGLADDVRELRARTKLTAQVLVAGVLAAVGLQLRLTHVPFIDVLLTIFWVTGVTNAINLLDNMDGLAAGIAAIGALFRLGFFVLDGNLDGAMLAAVFTGAVLGFLVHNFSPASIFMGDAGSLFLGFYLSGLSLVGGYPYSRSLMSVLLLPVLLLLVPIFDTTFVTISRSLARRPVSVGGRDHTSHRLVALGLSPRASVLSLYGVATLSGVVGVFTYRSGLSYGIVLIVFLALSVAVLGVYLSRIRVYPDQDIGGAEDRGIFRFVAALAYRRQLAALLVDVVLIAAAYYTSYLLRFESAIRLYDDVLVRSLPIVIVCQVVGLSLFGVQRGVWRYTGLRDLYAIARGALAGTAGAVVVLVFTQRFQGYSRAVFVIDGLLLVAFVSAIRLSMRALGVLLRPRREGPRKVLIYGAGDEGVLTCRELLTNDSLGRTVVGFIDDDRSKHRRRIEGVEVMGSCEELEGILSTEQVDEVLIASVKIAPANRRRVAGACEKRGIALKRASLRIE